MKRLTLIWALSFFLFFLSLPVLSPVREAHAVTTTVTWGTNTNGTDSVGGCVAPTGSSCGSGSSWGSGSQSSATVFNVSYDSNYTFASATLGGTACSTSSNTCRLNSSTPTTITISTGLSQTLTVKINPPANNVDVAYDLVDPGTLTWQDPPPSSADHGSLSINAGSYIRVGSLPDNTPVVKGGTISIGVNPDPYYAIQQVDYTTNGGTSWTQVTKTDSYITTLTGTDATTGGTVTTCGTSSAPTTTCSMTLKVPSSSAPNFQVRAAFKQWSNTIGVTMVTTAGNGTITPAPSSGLVTVTKNSDQTFNIAPDSNSRILDVTVVDATAGYNSATSVGAVSSYTFKNVAVNSDSIKVTFAPAIAPMTNYCQTPAFISNTQTVKPNVMLLFDDSGSMSTDAYTSNTCDGSKSYYGLFRNDRLYTYDSNTDTYTDAGPDSSYNKTTSPYSGNCLNLLTMSRVDVLRAALIGGKVKAGTRGTANNIIEGFRDCRVNDCSVVSNSTPPPGGPYYIVGAGAVEPTGIVQNLASKVNFGLMFFNPSKNTSPNNSYTDGGYVVNPIGSSTDTIVSSIEAQGAPASTPLAESLYEVTRYFQHTGGAYKYSVAANGTAQGSTANYASYTDPVTQTCQKNFVLILTDGNPNESPNLPGAGSKIRADGSSPVPWATCNNGAFAATTDSSSATKFNADSWLDKIYANEGNKIVTVPPGDVSSGNCSTSYVEAVAYYAHATDLRPDNGPIASKMLGTQNLTIYGVFSFNSAGASPSLINATKYGGFNDSDSDNKPDQDSEWYTRKNPDGSARTASFACSSTNPCPNSNTCALTSGTLSSGTCTCKLPDNYYSANEGSSMLTSLQDAMNSIIAQVSSGTAASILSNSQGTGANLLQAVFYPDKVYEKNSEVQWTGEMLNLWYYVDPFLNASSVHEDTDQDSTFTLSKDYTAQFGFNGTQTTVSLLNSSGVTVQTGMNPDDLHSLWRAGRQLWAKTPSSRNIFTSTSAANTTLLPFTTANQLSLAPYLQAAPASVDATGVEAGNIISWVRGSQVTSFRDRTAVLNVNNVFTSNQWKLGDIISSTPRVQSTQPLNQYHLNPPTGYQDSSYLAFINGANYAKRGMVYTGANDGMLHAFKLGTLSVLPGPDQIASLTGNTSGNPLGGEEWAFIPRNTLPYLRYLADPNYQHIYYVDGTPEVFDVAIAKPAGCSEANYWDCDIDKVAGSNWKTVVVAGMGVGGASRAKGVACTPNPTTTDCVNTPITDPADNTKGLGFSSYFALDVTGQYFNSDGTRANDPKLLWEFSDPGLGFATSDVAVVRINPLSNRTSGTPVKGKNGRWFAVFASGPTGPITGSQFQGRSDQTLQVYVVDLGATPPLTTSGPNPNAWVLSTSIPYAFGGSISNGVVDADRSNLVSLGNYQDDAIYFGYTKRTGNGTTDPYAWTDGGILRILTGENLDPTKWKISTVIDGIGAVTTNIAKLRDLKNHNLWIYTGTGRYFSTGDDAATPRKILGFIEPCYKQTVTHTAASSEGAGTIAHDAIDETCTTAVSGLTNQTDTPSATPITGSGGWFINLDPQDVTNSYGAERITTDPVAMPNGAIYFTSYKPTSNPCSFGGKTYVWGLQYNSGYALPPSVLQGKVLLQQSTGNFNQVELSSLTDKNGRRTADLLSMQGKPPGDPPPVVSKANLKPVKKILHMQER